MSNQHFSPIPHQEYTLAQLKHNWPKFIMLKSKDGLSLTTVEISMNNNSAGGKCYHTVTENLLEEYDSAKNNEKWTISKMAFDKLNEESVYFFRKVAKDIWVYVDNFNDEMVVDKIKHKFQGCFRSKLNNRGLQQEDESWSPKKRRHKSEEETLAGANYLLNGNGENVVNDTRRSIATPADNYPPSSASSVGTFGMDSLPSAPTCDFQSVQDKIDSCENLNDFRSCYKSFGFRNAIAAIRNSQDAALETQEVWAQKWATNMRSSPSDMDTNLENCRHLCLYFLYRFCDRFISWGDDMTAVIDDRWAQRLDNILDLCLVMDRANCLYRMKYRGQPFGMCWVSHEDTVLSPDEWNPLLDKYEGIPTINKRLIWLKNVPKLKFDRNLLKPLAALWCPTANDQDQNMDPL